MTDFKWKCLICEKDMEIDPGCQGRLDPALWPNVDGGTLAIDFGYPSRYDDMNGGFAHEGSREWQGCICDDCFDKKRDVLRHVKVEKRTMLRWTPIEDE